MQAYNPSYPAVIDVDAREIPKSGNTPIIREVEAYGVMQSDSSNKHCVIGQKSMSLDKKNESFVGKTRTGEL